MFPLICVGIKDPVQTAVIDRMVVSIPIYQLFVQGGCGKLLKMKLYKAGVGFIYHSVLRLPSAPIFVLIWKLVKEWHLAATCVTGRLADSFPSGSPSLVACDG